MNKIEELKKKKNEAEETLLEEILNNKNISKLDKLREIEESNLFPFAPYLERPLESKYIENFKKQIDDKFGKQEFHIIDSWPLIEMDYFGRGEHISLVSQLEYEIEEWGFDKSGNKLPEEDVFKREVVIMRNRSREEQDEYKITIGELIDDIFNWVVENKEIGFKFNW